MRQFVDVGGGSRGGDHPGEAAATEGVARSAGVGAFFPVHEDAALVAVARSAVIKDIIRAEVGRAETPHRIALSSREGAAAGVGSVVGPSSGIRVIEIKIARPCDEVLPAQYGEVGLANRVHGHVGTLGAVRTEVAPDVVKLVVGEKGEGAVAVVEDAEAVGNAAHAVAVGCGVTGSQDGGRSPAGRGDGRVRRIGAGRAGELLGVERCDGGRGDEERTGDGLHGWGLASCLCLMSG